MEKTVNLEFGKKKLKNWKKELRKIYKIKMSKIRSMVGYVIMKITLKTLKLKKYSTLKYKIKIF